MPNQIVLTRLKAIQAILTEAYGGGRGIADSAAGSEREAFVNLVLGNVIGPPFRIGAGEITDPTGAQSGQLDIVIEYGSSLSFPLLRGDASRLYLSEGVCAAIEIKSNVMSTWDLVLQKARTVRKLRHDVGSLITAGSPVPKHVPFFAVGYTGWKTVDTVEERIAACAGTDAPVDGVLVIDSGIYCHCPLFDRHAFSGPAALFGFLLSIEQLTSAMIGAKPHYRSYIT